MNHAPSAETKPKAYWFLRTQHQVLKELSKAQRATRKAQRDKTKLKTQRAYAHSARNQTTRLGLRNASHKGAQETQASDGLNS